MSVVDVNVWLGAFGLQPRLHAEALAVLHAMPEGVRAGLMADPLFRMSDYDPAMGLLVPVASPGRGRPARSVALKRTLLSKPTGFVRYIIAHELAHAYLWNAGRHVGEDPEAAADALAAEWGFAR